MANQPEVAGDGPGGGYVTPRGILALAVYLLAFTLGILWELHAWWPSCDPNVQAASSTASTSPAAAPPTGRTSPNVDRPPSGSPTGTESAIPSEPAPTSTQSISPVKLTSVSPKSGEVAGGTTVKITGDGFLDNPTVTFGGLAAIDVQRQSMTSIDAKTPAHAEGPVDVTVTNTDKTNPTSDTLHAGYTYDTCLSQCRSRLLLLVLLAGALGGCFHALRSLWMFVGDRNLKQSWALMYIILPVNGAVLAFIFFIIISAGSGFFSQPQGSNSCFWIIGIAALVGLFSQQAAEKLKTIADAFFTTVPPKSDPLSGGSSIASIAPDSGPVEGGTPVTITGKGFTNSSTVTFGGVAGVNFKLGSPASITVNTPPGKAAGPVDVVVTDPGSNAKDAKKPGGFTYTA